MAVSNLEYAVSAVSRFLGWADLNQHKKACGFYYYAASTTAPPHPYLTEEDAT